MSELDYEYGVPVIDLSPCLHPNALDTYTTNPHQTSPCKQVALAIGQACSTYGFFQITNHGIPPSLIDQFRHQVSLLFAQESSVKDDFRRNKDNSRGYFDDELTKQRRDWKQGWDTGVPGSRDWQMAEHEKENACLDGYNRFPDPEVLPEYRQAFVTYFEECARVSDVLARLMHWGLLLLHTSQNETAAAASEKESVSESLDFINQLQTHHTSYLRLNYYPPCPLPPSDTPSSAPTSLHPPPLGISPHTDAGFLTVLLQDDDCHSLQVERHTTTNNNNNTTEPQQAQENDNTNNNDQDQWVTVRPLSGALTINTGAMAQIWSNGWYKAPLHRVLTDPCKKRYSAPFFYNPGYTAMIQPCPEVLQGNRNNHDENKNTCSKEEEEGGRRRYHACNWGYFRAVRYAGDFADYGTEIQLEHYEVGHEHESNHVKAQNVFLQEVDFYEPFEVEKYRSLLEKSSGGAGVGTGEEKV